MTRYILGITLIVFAAVLGAALSMHITQSNTASPVPAAASESNSASNATASSSAAPSANNQNGYTLADVAKHNSGASCWAAINGNVYDLTNWINQHPGGPEHILAICGTDGSAAFNQQHGGQSEPAQELATFLIGPLIQ